MRVVPEGYNGAEKFLSPSDTVAVETSQPHVLPMVGKENTAEVGDTR